MEPAEVGDFDLETQERLGAQPENDDFINLIYAGDEVIIFTQIHTKEPLRRDFRGQRRMTKGKPCPHQS